MMLTGRTNRVLNVDCNNLIKLMQQLCKSVSSVKSAVFLHGYGSERVSVRGVSYQRFPLLA